MCVGFTNGYYDFKPAKWTDSLNVLKAGSAISFDRIGYYHFAIFLGRTEGENVPIMRRVVCVQTSLRIL